MGTVIMRILLYVFLCLFVSESYAATNLINCSGNNKALQSTANPPSYSCSQISGTSSNQWTVYDAIGDGVSAGGHVTEAQSYPQLIENDFQGGFNNWTSAGTYNYDCDMVGEVIFPNLNPGLGSPPMITWLPSVEDPVYGGTPISATHEAITHSCRQAGLEWATIPSQFKVLGQSAGCVQTGAGWSNDSAFGGAIGVVDHTNGDSLACTITTTGAPVYAWYKLVGNNGGTFTYSVDGGATTSLSTQGAGNDFSYPVGTFISVGSVRLPVTAGSHTVTFTVTSSTNSSNTVTIEGIGTAPTQPYYGLPSIYYGGQIYQYNDANSAETAQYNTDEQTDANLLKSDGLNVNFVNVRNYINSTTDMQSGNGGFYPSVSGHVKLQQAFEGALQFQKNTAAGGELDVRNFGAVCDGIYADGRNPATGGSGGYGPGSVTASSNVLSSVTNYTFSSADVGKDISINGGYGGSTGSTSDLGVNTGTILSVDTVHNTATMSITPTQSSNTVYIIFGTNNAAAANAAGAAAQAAGGSVYVPTNCAGTTVTTYDNVTYNGGSAQVGYPYVNTTPVWYILSTGFTEDSTSIGWDITAAGNRALKGFEIKGLTSPFQPFGGGGLSAGSTAELACVGTPSGTQPYNDSILLENMTLANCWVGLGVPLQAASQSGHIVAQSRFSEYTNLYAGWYGNYSDSVSVDDVFTSDQLAGIDFAGLSGSAFSSASDRIIGDRFEEDGGSAAQYFSTGLQTAGIICNSCVGTHLEGVEFQFNYGFAILLAYNWREFSVTGGMMQNNGSSLYSNFTGSISGTTLTISGGASPFYNVQLYEQVGGVGVTPNTYISAFGSGTGGAGTYTVSQSQTVGSESMSANMIADIGLEGNSATSGRLNMSNAQFPAINSNVPNWILYAMTSGTNNPQIDIEGGDLYCTGTHNSYNNAIAQWNNGTPGYLKITTQGCPQLDVGRSDISMNAASSECIGCSSADPSSRFDVESTTLGSLPAPQMTTTQKNAISSPKEGLFAYDLTLHDPYFWNGSAWTAFVNSFTGDNVILGNSASTGAVTATLVNAAANSILGNNTSSPVAPAYQHNINITGAITAVPSTLTISTATFTPVAVASNTYRVVLIHASCPCTIATPSGSPRDGDRMIIEVWQSSTGNDTIGTWGTGYDFGTTGSPTLSTGANKGDILGFSYSSQNSKWNYLGITQGM